MQLLPMKMNLRSFRQSQPWVRLAACKLNLLKRSSSDARHQRVFYLSILPSPNAMNTSTSPISSTSIPMSSITDNLFAEKFLDQLLSLPIWATKINLSQCQSPKRKPLKPIPFSDNTTEKNCLLLMKMEHKSKTVKMSLTVGTLRILRVKNCKRKSRLRLVQIKIKNSSLLLKLQRTNWPRESYLSSMLKLKRNQSLLKSNLTTKALRLLAKRRSSTPLKFSFSVILTTQESNAWNNCSTRVHNLMLYLSLLRKLQVSKDSNCHSRT